MAKKVSETASILDTLVPPKIAAEALRVTTRRLHQLVAEGWIKKADRGVFRLGDVFGGYLEFRDACDKDASRNVSKQRTQNARTREIELRISEKTRELVPYDEAKSFAMELVGNVIAVVSTIPARYTRDKDERKRLQALVDQVRGEVGGELEKICAAYEAASGDVDPATDETDA